MDAYSISYTSPSGRNSSRIYQDLRSIRLHSLDTSHLTRKLSAMAKSSPTSSPHIGIIGAGLSGLRCADILLQYGFKLTIIEGRDRIGGRVSQHQLPNGHFVDVGPNWIHGTSDNPILDLAKQTRTDTSSWDTRSYAFDDAGELFDVDDSDVYADMMWGIVEDAFKYSNQHGSDIDENESLHEFFLRKVAEKIPETEPKYERKRQTLMQTSELWGAFIGSPIERQSLKFFWMEERIEGENLFCAGTYQKILAHAAKPALGGAEIKLNARAEKIKYGNASDSSATVQLEGDQSLAFNAVVVTSPLGWLKQNLNAFEPALPARLSQAIQSIEYGCLEKVYITFPQAFWLAKHEEDREVQGFVQWLSPSYAPDTNPNRWNQECVELAGLTPSSSHPTLLFYIYGDQSRYLTSHTLSLKTKSQKDAFLLDFFKPYYSRLPHYDHHDEICQPSSCFATDWLHDDLAGNGSYSNFQVGLTDGDGDVRVMREGLPEQGLWFAGEHTAAFAALGTSTGAYWSGEAVARRIAQKFGFKKEDGAEA